MKNILITGGGAPGAPGIINSVKSEYPDLTIFSCDFQDVTAGKFLADYYFTVPLGSDANYSETLLQLCTENDIEIVLPITTRELTPLSQAKDKFKSKGIHVLVSDQKPLDIANNKGTLYSHLTNCGIQVPRFKTAQNYDEYLEAKKHVQKNNDRFIIKPCVGNGSRGFRIIDSTTDRFDLLFNYKPNSTFIQENELDSLLQQNKFPEIVVSEYLPGDEYTVDCLVHQGDAKLIVPRKREKMNNGISVSGTIENNSKVISYCKKILAAIDLHGPIGIQVKYSSNNEPVLVEINPRIQGTTVACIGAGVNIPALCFQDFSTLKQSGIDIKWGTKFIRYYSELYFEH